MIRELIQILVILLFGMDNGPKHDLRKKEKVSFLDSVGKWVLQRAHIILPLLIIILLLLTGAVIGIIVSGGNITCVESGNYYYHLQDVV